MELVIAGLAGAVVAVIFVYLHTGITSRTSSRSALAMEIVSWADDIYDRLITIHAQRDASFTDTAFGLSNDEYRTTVKEVKSMLLASKMRAKVALVYGKGTHLYTFDTLREEFIAATEDLLGATKETWPEDNARINRRFADVIEPRMRSAETLFVQSSRPFSLTGVLARTGAPTLYLPVHGTETPGAPHAPSPVSSLRRAVSWQSVRLVETVFTVARALAVVAAVLVTVWLAIGAPDPRPYLVSSVAETSSPVSLPPAELGIWSPAEYGIASGGDAALIGNGAVLTVAAAERAFRFAVRNPGTTPLVNPFVVMTVPAETTAVRDDLWKDAWRETPGRAGRSFTYHIQGTVRPDEIKELDPPIELRLPASGSWRFAYRIFSDTKDPRTGHFTVRVSPDGRSGMPR